MVWKVVDTRFFDYTNDEDPDAIMALSNIAGWNENRAGSACGASDKPAACGASEKPAACGAGDKPAETPAACGAADKPEEKPAACGSACGAGDK